jgi:hypothetical protein
MTLVKMRIPPHRAAVRMKIPLRFIKSLRRFWFVVPLLIAATSLQAIDVRSTDLYTLRDRIDSSTWESEPLGIFNPTGVLVAGEDLIIRSGTSITGRLWRYTPATGKSILLGSDFPALIGINVIAGILDNEVFIVRATNPSGTAAQTIAVNLETLESRPFQIDGQNVVLANLLLTGNGNLIAKGGTAGGVRVLNAAGEVIANSGGLEGSTLHAFTTTADGRVIGISSGQISFVPLVTFVELVEINAADGTISSLARLPDGDIFEGIGVPVGFASSPAGDYYLIARSGNDFSLHRLNGTTFALSEIPLPEGVELDLLSTVTVDPDGKLLVVALDNRLPGLAASGRHVFRIDPETHDSQIAVGGAGILDIGHIAPGNDQAIYYVPKPSGVGNQDYVLRWDLKTGGVTVVTSGKFEGALIDRGRQIAVDEQDIYVVNEDTGQTAHLIHVDAATGAQTFLAELGNRLFIQKMIFDEATGDLLMTTWGGHPQGGFGTVMRVRPEPGAHPAAITQTPFRGNPRGLRVAENGDIFVTGRASATHDIYRVDRTTGGWTVVSESPLFRGLLDLAILDDGKLAVGDGPAQAVFLVDPTTGEAMEVISNTPVGEYLIRLAAPSELPPESVVLSIEVEGEELVLAFVSRLGFTYQLQHSMTTIAWADLGDPVAGDGSILEFRQNIVSSTAVEHFRTRIDPSD